MTAEMKTNKERTKKIVYKDIGILELLIELLQYHHRILQIYDYKKYLAIKAEKEAKKTLNNLQSRLDTLYLRYEKSKNNPQNYFLDEGEYINFIEELYLVKALKYYFILVKDKKPIPEVLVEPDMTNFKLLFEEWGKRLSFPKQS